MTQPFVLMILLAALGDDPTSSPGAESVPAAEVVDPATENASEPGKDEPAPTDERKPIRLRRDRGDNKEEAAKKRALPAEKEEKAPPVQDRNIPSPDDKPPANELDRDLLGELGQGLEKGEEEQTDPLLRAGQRMRDVEGRLARHGIDEDTIQVQEKIIADLEELLKQQQSGKPPPNQNKKPQKKDQQQQAEMQRQQQQAKQQANNQPASKASDRAGPARSGREEFGTPKETKDVWGHLSEMLREEMSQYAKEGFLEKYRDLLEQYYSTIAARSQSR